LKRTTLIDSNRPRECDAGLTCSDDVHPELEVTDPDFDLVVAEAVRGRVGPTVWTSPMQPGRTWRRPRPGKARGLSEAPLIETASEGSTDPDGELTANNRAQSVKTTH
jgi:hypothetical protein